MNTNYIKGFTANTSGIEGLLIFEGEIYLFDISIEEGMCASGYAPARYSKVYLRELEDNEVPEEWCEHTDVCVPLLSDPRDWESNEEIFETLFTVSNDGDGWYPDFAIEIHWDECLCESYDRSLSEWSVEAMRKHRGLYKDTLELLLKDESGCFWRSRGSVVERLQKREDFGPFTHIPARQLIFRAKIEIEFDYNLETLYVPDEIKDIGNYIFVRGFRNRPVWIFTGPSGLGKSTLGYLLGAEKKVIYETDSSNGVLPDVIDADIVVLGNKYNYSVDEIKERISEDAEIIIADFHR